MVTLFGHVNLKMPVLAHDRMKQGSYAHTRTHNNTHNCSHDYHLIIKSEPLKNKCNVLWRRQRKIDTKKELGETWGQKVLKKWVSLTERVSWTWLSRRTSHRRGQSVALYMFLCGPQCCSRNRSTYRNMKLMSFAQEN